ncbi:uncharacterized protein GLRG_11014 [Colletotrichum graminicola M1.001]|uniref:Uncharacterized protein n=1 Tax=Colletotrichum graminicola (strain M1.001 / M2 / FGSC 10212) TaxID=645133 RepID=E3QYG8_COLGM|nr:uncharacterized protein GLRG_11014 [Colletotrichum graminicola M1.001]EFQ35906.1 hypothetical protein GLRG_11014 [Colletotrichum graminicola M1.001]
MSIAADKALQVCKQAQESQGGRSGSQPRAKKVQRTASHRPSGKPAATRAADSQSEGTWQSMRQGMAGKPSRWCIETGTKGQY